MNGPLTDRPTVRSRIATEYTLSVFVCLMWQQKYHSQQYELLSYLAVSATSACLYVEGRAINRDMVM